jgi:1-acyl-sn-glycerol-3-phosphate acyltransferase
MSLMTAAMVGLARLVSGASPRWTGCAPDTRQRVYFANHSSHLDALVLWAVLPAPVRALTRPVAALDYWTATRLRRYLATDVFQAVLIERRRVATRENPLAEMLAALGDRHSLILFPEGGRQPGPDPGPFKSGLFHLAKDRPEVEFVPVLMENLNRILPKGEVLPVPLLGSVSFGPPLPLQPGEEKSAFLERARKAVLALRQL